MTELNRRTAMFTRPAQPHPDLAVDVAAQARLADLRIDTVLPDPGNPRRTFDQTKLEELAAGFKATGIIQPIIVRPGEGGAHIIIAGERRWRAAKIAGHVSIKAIIRPALNDETTLLFAQIIENESREDLCTRDLVEAVTRLVGLGVAKKDIATRLACDPSRISRLIALADLPLSLQPFLDTMLVDPLYELAQQWKRDEHAVRGLLATDPQPTRAAIRKLASPDHQSHSDRIEAERGPGLAPAQVEPPIEMPKEKSARVPGCNGHGPSAVPVTVRVRHHDHGEGRVVPSPAIVGDHLPILFDGHDVLIQTSLAELTIVAIE